MLLGTHWVNLTWSPRPPALSLSPRRWTSYLIEIILKSKPGCALPALARCIQLFTEELECDTNHSTCKFSPQQQRGARVQHHYCHGGVLCHGGKSRSLRADLAGVAAGAAGGERGQLYLVQPRPCQLHLHPRGEEGELGRGASGQVPVLGQEGGNDTTLVHDSPIELLLVFVPLEAIKTVLRAKSEAAVKRDGLVHLQ